MRYPLFRLKREILTTVKELTGNVLLALSTVDADVPVECFCDEGPEVCANNHVTYKGVCNMKCAGLLLDRHLYVVHEGKCID
ncbi:unnamed protein product [Colias eurytheme]|nr:unnamed protein product [Colias eurytheme]